MRKRPVLLILLGLLLFISYSVVNWMAIQKEKDALEVLVKDISGLQLLHVKQDVWLVEAATRINNDDIGSVNRAFKETSAMMWSHLQPFLGGALQVDDEQLRHDMQEHLWLIEDCQSDHAVIKNSIAIIQEHLKEFELVTNKQTFERIEKIRQLVLDYYRGNTSTITFDNALKISDSRLALLMLHVNVVTRYMQKLDETKQQKQHLYLDDKLFKLKESVTDLIREKEDALLQFGWLMIITSILFLIIGMVVLRRESKSRDQLGLLTEELEKTNKQLKLESENSMNLAQELAEFASALDASAIVSKTDTRGIITYANDKFCKLSGYSREELIGSPHNIIRHPDMPSEVFEELWQTIKSKHIFHATIKNRKKNGTAYYVDSFVIPIRDIHDNIIEYMAVRYDVTELVASRDEALAARQAKDRFLANMSHELRTPLNAIIGFNQILLKKSEDEIATKYLSMMAQSSDKLLHLINDILDLSKIQSGKFQIHESPFNIRYSLLHLTEEFKAQLTEKKITLKLAVDNLPDIVLKGDWMRVSQILSNLMSNAIKFTETDGTIQVKARYEHGRFYCEVEDNGIGMSPEVQEKIFKPFEQAQTNTAHNYGGTGLGLSISKELANMMDGSLILESEEGKGSRFTLELPLSEYED